MQVVQICMKTNSLSLSLSLFFPCHNFACKILFDSYISQLVPLLNRGESKILIYDKQNLMEYELFQEVRDAQAKM